MSPIVIFVLAFAAAACANSETDAPDMAQIGEVDAPGIEQPGPIAAGDCNRDLRPIMFVHGGFGGGDNFELQAQRLTSKLLFPKGHPYAPDFPSDAEIDGITPESLRAFHDIYYRPGNAYLILSGDVTQADVQKLLALTQASPHPEMADDGPEQWGAEVRVTMKDGRVAARRVEKRRVHHAMVERGGYARRQRRADIKNYRHQR